MSGHRPTIKAVAFDLDGTLVDSAPDIQHAVNVALRDAGLQRFDLATVRSWIGDGPDVLIARALVAQGADAADPDLRARLRRGFDAATLASPLGAGSVYPGIVELLDVLRGQYPLAVVSNKPTPLSRAVIEAAGLLPYFNSVHGADTAALRKPAPLMLQTAAQLLGVSTAELLMVGDSPLDINSAKSAGCPAVLVTWGYGAHAEGIDETVPRVATPQGVLAQLAPSHARPVGAATA